MDPDYTGYMTRWLAMAELGRRFGIELTQVAIRARADVENAIAEFAREPNGALIVFSSALTTANSRLIVGRRKIPVANDLSFLILRRPGRLDVLRAQLNGFVQPICIVR
jgi:hypothetical protein